MAGLVDALGDGVEGLATGDRVAAEPLASCGRCDYCRAGRDSICPEVQVFGIHRHGGFAEYAVLPARRLFKVAGDLDPRIAALSEPMAVAVHGLRLGRFQADQRVLVLGAGTVGLLTAKAAVALGAGEVWLTARHPHQAELGAHLGATRVLREAEASREDLFRLGCEAPIDLVVETVGGTADTLRSAASAVRPGGTISVLGIFLGDVALDTLPLLLKENTLTWSNCYSRTPEGADFDTAVELVENHRDELDEVATHQVPLEEIARAFALAGDKKAGAVKVTVVP
jgi:threonine dehydrogenase-like Zn-dependent dehydrogenase